MTRRTKKHPPSSQKNKRNIQKASENDQKKLSIAVHEERHFSGPLPPPEILAEYNDVVKGSAEIIINQFIEQGNHRRKLEEYVIKNDVKRANWGLAAGFIIALTTIIGSLYIISIGFRLEGMAAIIFALASLAAAFFYGVYSRRKERVEKEQALLRKLNH